MNNPRFSQQQQDASFTYGSSARAASDAGLRAYMLSVYNYMVLGLGVTGMVAFGVANSDLVRLFYNAQGPTILAYVAMFAPLAFVFALSAGIQRMKSSTAAMLFFVFSGVMGLSMVHIFLTFTGASVARVFFITASMFAVTSLYGYTTKRDLTSIGSFLFMGLIGIVIASVVNIFLQSSMMHFIISIVGVVVFVGLTAYDTQRIRSSYYATIGSPEIGRKLAINGALSLYLNFINLFMIMLSFLGDRR